jgi:hypothetical protein
LENVKGDERIILKWILKEQDVRVWTGFICRRIGPSGDLF